MYLTSISADDASEYIKDIVAAEAENLIQIVSYLTKSGRSGSSQEIELLLYILRVLRAACKDPAEVTFEDIQVLQIQLV